MWIIIVRFSPLRLCHFVVPPGPRAARLQPAPGVLHRGDSRRLLEHLGVRGAPAARRHLPPRRRRERAAGVPRGLASSPPDSPGAKVKKKRIIVSLKRLLSQSIKKVSVFKLNTRKELNKTMQSIIQGAHTEVKTCASSAECVTHN